MASIGLNVGLKALLTAQTALDTVGHNISNANTPGYSRQSLQISSSPALMLRGLTLGNGVQADVILRTADALLHRRMVGQLGSFNALDARWTGMSQVEAYFGEPGETGVAALMNGFFESITSLAANPADKVLQGGAVQASVGLAERMRSLSGDLAALKQDNAAQIAVRVGQVNQLTESIVALNQKIASFEHGGMPANDLRDQRDLALVRLAEFIDIKYHEGQDGNVTVTTSGALLVGANRAYALDSSATAQGIVTLSIEGHPDPIEIKGGSIGGLLQLADEFLPELSGKLDTLAHQLILDANRAHSTGMPAGGPFGKLAGVHAVQDVDGDGVLLDQLLAQSGLPFDVQAGALYVNVTQQSTGTFTTERIDIDPATSTVADLLDALNAVAHLGAGLDQEGRLVLEADAGYAFDFSKHVNAHPDHAQSFGGTSASLSTAFDGPFNLADGDTLDLVGPGGAFTFTFDGADFADITQATAAEVAAAINADPATAANGLGASVVGGRVVLQSNTSGASASLTVASGTALGALGWTAATTTSGQANAVQPTISGAYGGTSNAHYTFVPNMDGTIGTTAGLEVHVFDADGAQVATLDVGAGYVPGTKLAIAHGLQASFGFGELSATDNDVFALDALADSDESDVLVALGVNALFTGSTASDIGVRDYIELDPDRFAGSSGPDGDNGVLLELIAAGKATSEALGGANLGQYYGSIVGDLGYSIESAGNAREVDQFLIDSLQAQRDAQIGVNVDEELVAMIQFEQAFGAAARYIQVVNATNDEILRLI